MFVHEYKTRTRRSDWGKRNGNKSTCSSDGRWAPVFSAAETVSNSIIFYLKTTLYHSKRVLNGRAEVYGCWVKRHMRTLVFFFGKKKQQFFLQYCGRWFTDAKQRYARTVQKQIETFRHSFACLSAVTGVELTNQ